MSLSRTEPVSQCPADLPLPQIEQSLNQVKRREEAKREALQDPLVRWRATLGFLAWAAAQPTAPQATPAARKAKERRLLAGLEKGSQPSEVRSHD